MAEITVKWVSQGKPKEINLTALNDKQVLSLVRRFLMGDPEVNPDANPAAMYADYAKAGIGNLTEPNEKEIIRGQMQPAYTLDRSDHPDALKCAVRCPECRDQYVRSMTKYSAVVCCRTCNTALFVNRFPVRKIAGIHFIADAVFKRPARAK